MGILKLSISVLDIVFALLMYFFQREQTHKPTKIGFWAMIILFVLSAILIWK